MILLVAALGAACAPIAGRGRDGGLRSAATVTATPAAAGAGAAEWTYPCGRPSAYGRVTILPPGTAPARPYRVLAALPMRGLGSLDWVRALRMEACELGADALYFESAGILLPVHREPVLDLPATAWAIVYLRSGEGP
jgi:hypothetical protein